MSEPLVGDGFLLRRAKPEDVDFMAGLVTHEDVAPFMSASALREPGALLADVERSEREPREYGRFVVDVDGRPAGLLGFEVENRRSRIAHLFGIMLHPDFRGRGIADGAARLLVRHLVLDFGYHRVQLECYGFNERAMRHAERAGFVREGVKRSAYWRHGSWVDGVVYGLVREDLENPSSTFDAGALADELERARSNFQVGSRLLLENERVRVWDITLAPGERLPFHCHRTSYFYRCESAGRSRVRTPDGTVTTYESPLDEVVFHRIEPGEELVHDLANVGDTVLRFTTVELV